MKISLTAIKNPASDVTHGENLPRPKNDVITLDGVSRQPNIFGQSESSFTKISQFENCGHLFLFCTLPGSKCRLDKQAQRQKKKTKKSNAPPPAYRASTRTGTLLRPHRGQVRRHIHDLLPSSALGFRLEFLRFKKRAWQINVRPGDLCFVSSQLRSTVISSEWNGYDTV